MAVVPRCVIDPDQSVACRAGYTSNDNLVKSGSTDMESNVLPKMDMSVETTGCCPKFNPEGWDGRHLHFKDKLFVRATTRSLLHVPINMGTVFSRVQGHIPHQKLPGRLLPSPGYCGCSALPIFSKAKGN